MTRSPCTTAQLATRAAALAAAGALLAACGGSTAASTPPAVASPTGSAARTPAQAASPTAVATESSPPGDIPDNQLYVPYTPPGAGFSVQIPEGWARSVSGSGVVFTDKLNSISIRTANKAAAPTPASVRAGELASIAAGAPKYALGKVSTVSRRSGPAVLVTYAQDSPPDPVTGKLFRQSVERYEFWRAGTTAVLTLSGPSGADNVDPWRIVTDSVTWK